MIKQEIDWSKHLFWGVLLLITLSEMLTAVQPQAGIIFCAVLLALLLTCSGIADRVEVRNLALALSLAPMIRLLSLSLPLPRIPQMAWYPVVSILLLISFWLIARVTGMTRKSLGLRVGNLPLQVALVLIGPGLGALEYLILQPGPQQTDSWLRVTLMSMSLLIFTGLVEELIFRGLLQNLAALVLGRWGLVYVSVLFGVLHIGYLSWIDVIFATVVGLAFAQLVRWSGSLLGVTLAHGLTNITLFIALPALAQQPGFVLDSAIGGLIALGMLALALVGGIIGLEALTSAPAHTNIPFTGLRELRLAHKLTYVELANRAGIPVRRLAELEFGLVAAAPDEIGRVAAVLGTTNEGLRIGGALA